MIARGRAAGHVCPKEEQAEDKGNATNVVGGEQGERSTPQQMDGFFAQIHAAIGRAAPCFAAALLVGAGLYTALYLRRKNAADNAFLERAGEPG